MKWTIGGFIIDSRFRQTSKLCWFNSILFIYSFVDWFRLPLLLFWFFFLFLVLFAAHVSLVQFFVIDTIQFGVRICFFLVSLWMCNVIATSTVCRSSAQAFTKCNEERTKSKTTRLRSIVRKEKRRKKNLKKMFESNFYFESILSNCFSSSSCIFILNRAVFLTQICLFLKHFWFFSFSHYQRTLIDGPLLVCVCVFCHISN